MYFWQICTCRFTDEITSAYLGVLPPCIRGRAGAQLAEGQVEMGYIPNDTIPPEQLISATSNDQLVKHLCRARAVFSFTVNGYSINAWPH